MKDNIKTQALITLRAGILTCLLCIALGGWALTPSQILDKSASTLMKSKGVTAAYTVSMDGQKASGTLKAKGKKFFIDLSGTKSWYDGKNLWNFDMESQEVTLSVPTAKELATLSPYAFVSSYRNIYNPSALKSNIPGTYAIKLTPKNPKGSQIAVAVVYIRTSDFMPVRLDLTGRNKKVSTLTVTSIKTGVNIPDTQFVFPKSQYPKSRLVDLR